MAAIALVSLAAIYVSSYWVRTAAQTRRAPLSVPDVSWTEPPKGNPSPVASHLPNFLTNEEVIEISGSGLATATLVGLISRMPHRFTVDPQSISKLKQSGVPEAVILVMLELTAADTPTGSGETTRGVGRSN